MRCVPTAVSAQKRDAGGEGRAVRCRPTRGAPAGAHSAAGASHAAGAHSAAAGASRAGCSARRAAASSRKSSRTSDALIESRLQIFNDVCRYSFEHFQKAKLKC